MITKYFGILLVIVSIGFLIYFPIDINKSRTVKIIDKYKGRTDHEDANGILYYDDMLYLVVKYNNGFIERKDVSVETYYGHNIGDNYIFNEVIGTTVIGNWSWFALILGLILIPIGAFRQQEYDYYI